MNQESTESVYLMLLDKSQIQEEFIRGQLTNNPYNSAETGPLMRDVKNFICRELDMEGEPPVNTVGQQQQFAVLKIIGLNALSFHCIP